VFFRARTVAAHSRASIARAPCPFSCHTPARDTLQRGALELALHSARRVPAGLRRQPREQATADRGLGLRRQCITKCRERLNRAAAAAAVEQVHDLLSGVLNRQCYGFLTD
jgi:hypothetical protein